MKSRRRPIWWLILEEVRAGIGREPEIHRGLVTGSRTSLGQFVWLKLIGPTGLSWHLKALQDQGLVSRHMVESGYDNSLKLHFYHLTPAGFERWERGE